MVAAAHFGLFWPELAVSACFGGRFVWNQLYRHVSAVSVPISAGIGLFWPELAPIWLSRHESKKKGESRQVGHRIGLRYGDLGAASVLSS